MSKKTVIYIACAVAVVLIIAIAVYFGATSKKSEVLSQEQKIVITRYDEDFKVDKTIDVTDKKTVKEIEKISKNISLEQDEEAQYYAIRNDIKVDLGNDKFFMIQTDFDEYCYYEDSNSDTRLIIKTPEGLLDIINKILEDNQ